MKKLLILPAVLSLSALLSACGGGGTPPLTSPPTSTLSNILISGKITGTDLQIDSASLLSYDNPFFGEATVKNNILTLDLSQLIPGSEDLMGASMARDVPEPIRTLRPVSLKA
ncbi:hypothetical protein ACFP9V_01385 [Deinococcus radiopugnans]|uniref:hypothetical protein n=1 Tax=Deinococcus radiopugnans TaxID=57497 RepID=UPI003608B71A